MKNINWKDVAIRAVKTFFQTAISYTIAAFTGVNFFDGDNKETVIVGALVSAGAAGVSAVWNTVLAPIFKPSDPKAEEIREEEEVQG